MMTPVLRMSQFYALPRPDRVYRRFWIQRQLSEIDSDLFKNILLEYGCKVKGMGSRPFERGRSSQWVIETGSGKKLLKRYKSTVPMTTMAQEHSILTYLAQIDFPSPRLNTTTSGLTLLHKEGQSYALFDYLDGYFQYHHYLFSPTQTRRFIELSGQILGTLHTVLKDFTPIGHNPDGFKSRTGERWRDLDWYMNQLEGCREENPKTGISQSHPMRSMFDKNAGWVEDLLYSLDEKLNAAALPRLLIHGDFGPYNLFFKPGSPVVVLDFELASLDWPLLDLSKAFQYFAKNRLGLSLGKMETFIQAYRSSRSMVPDELKVLPEVWLFQLLRRLIVCWYRYFHGSEDAYYLSTADEIIQLSKWVIAHQKSLSTLS